MKGDWEKTGRSRCVEITFIWRLEQLHKVWLLSFDYS